MKVKPNFTVFNQQSMLVDFLKNDFPRSSTDYKTTADYALSQAQRN